MLTRDARDFTVALVLGTLLGAGLTLAVRQGRSPGSDA